MTEKPKTIGQAIDQILEALGGLEPAARTTVLNAVTSHLGLAKSNSTAFSGANSTPQSQTPAAVPPLAPSGASSASLPSAVDIRTFRHQKKPESANQMACVVAFYLQELAPGDQKSETLKTADLEKYFKQAGYPLPQDVSQVLRDSKRAGYFESASRGAYKLNAVGYNLVAHKLPKSSGAE